MKELRGGVRFPTDGNRLARKPVSFLAEQVKFLCRRYSPDERGFMIPALYSIFKKQLKPPKKGLFYFLAFAPQFKSAKEFLFMNNRTKSTTNIQKLTTMALLCAIAFAGTVLMHSIPVMPSAPYLSLDPKDAVIAIGGFIFGPIAALVMTLVVSLVEMVTISSTGFIGLLMNVLSTGVFVTVSTIFYHRKPKLKNAVIGLMIGTVSMTLMMILWNFLITPIYTGAPREVIVPMLPTVFLPFNLLKGTINSGITLFLYKTVVTALRKAKLLPKSDNSEQTGKEAKKNTTLMVMISSAVLIAACVLIILVLNNKI